MSDQSRKHVVPTGTKAITSKEQDMSSTSLTGTSDNKMPDVTSSVADFLATKAEGFKDARFYQYVTVQTTIALLMFLADRESVIPNLPYEGARFKGYENGFTLTRKVLADCGRSDRNQGDNAKDGRLAAHVIVRNWLSHSLGVDHQSAAKLMEFCTRLLDLNYGLRDWNGVITSDANGKVTVAGTDEQHPLLEKQNPDHETHEVPGLFRVKPRHVFSLKGKEVPEVLVAHMEKVRDPNTKEDVEKPYPNPIQELTLCDRSHVFMYGDLASGKGDYQSVRCGRQTFMNATANIVGTPKKTKGKPDAGTGGTGAGGAGTGGGAAPGGGAVVTPPSPGAAPGAAPVTAPGATGAGVGAASGANRAGGNQSREDAEKAARDAIATVDHTISVLSPGAITGNPTLISAAMRLHLHLTLLLNGLGAVEYTSNPNDDTRKAVASAFSMSGGKPITPVGKAPAKATPASTPAKRSK